MKLNLLIIFPATFTEHWYPDTSYQMLSVDWTPGVGYQHFVVGDTETERETV